MNSIVRSILFLSIFFMLSESTIWSFDAPVDIVYTWVDGSDPVWQAIKDRYLLLYRAGDGYADYRFANNDELRYSLRSVWQYAPFVNHIYILTMGQRPKWLADHPMITIVEHQDIFKNKSDLPTFNSHAIESNLHRIPGLSEHFIYFNDDVFLGSSVTKNDFFTNDFEIIKVLFERYASPEWPIKPHESTNDQAVTTYRNAWRNTNALLNQLFFKERRYRLCHAPLALRRSFLEQLESRVPAVFIGNASHRFRCDKDYNIVNGLIQYYVFYEGKLVRGNLTNKLMTLKNDQFLTETIESLSAITQKRPATFCIEDEMKGESGKTKQVLSQFLNQLYPQPAPWEKE